jgi:multiple antibiotic resistance protein
VPGWLEPYVVCFVPLLVAIDPVAIAPFYAAAVEGRPAAVRRKVLAQALFTATAVGLAFLFVGRWLLGLIGVTVPDFAVAGGVVLLVIAVVDIVMADKGARRMRQAGAEDESTFGAVPLGMPLVVGPATLTTLVLLLGRYGTAPVLGMFLANMALVWLGFSQSERLLRGLGKAGARAVGKVSSLVLAAIAVKMVRTGVEAILGGS